MSRVRLVGRLVSRDLRHRPGPAILLVLAITAATATLTLGLVLHGVTVKPYQQTRAATLGPDVVAYVGGPGAGPHGPGQTNQAAVTSQVSALTHAAGVVGYSGPYPVASAVVRFDGRTADLEAEGRAQAPASVEQPKVTAGTWVRRGGVVLERTFAQALGVTVGDQVTLNGRPFRVAGIAVTAASVPYPNLCYDPGGDCVFYLPGDARDIGFGWVTGPDASALIAAARVPSSSILNLKLADPARAPAFASAHGDNPGPGEQTGPGSLELIPWQAIQSTDGLLVQDEQQVLSPGAWLAGLLAIASVAVLAGGRMAERTRRVGLLKAVGASPGRVAAVLLAENLVLALFAAVAGLLIAWFAAPLIASPGAALVGTPGAPSLRAPDAALTVAVALLIALVATLGPAIRASRTSTVSALANSARPPRRRALLIGLSAGLPVPLLLGLRLIARRPRRALLGAASVAVATTGIVAVLAFHATVHLKNTGLSQNGLGNPVVDRDEQMLLIITVVLVALAVLNALCTAWATVLDAAQASALARALGATPHQVTAGIATVQVLPAIPGALLGIPLGIGLFAAAAQGAGLVVPPGPWLVAAVLGTLVAVALLTAVPARIGARRPVSPILHADAA